MTDWLVKIVNGLPGITTCGKYEYEYKVTNVNNIDEYKNSYMDNDFM